MSFSPEQVRRHFLSWQGPWLPQAVTWLTREWAGKGPIDLSAVLAIVPTRHAGRRLREALAAHAAAHGTAAFAPQVMTPDALLANGAAGSDVATRLEALLAWTEVLRDVDLAEVSDLFSVAPVRRDFAWAWRLAENFVALQTQLTEGGLSFANVVGRAGDGFPEAARWDQLALLEQRQVEHLARLGRKEPHAARRAFALRPPLQAGVARIVVLAAPDPLPLATQLLAAWSRAVPVDVVIFAPESEANAFDAWGRPIETTWTERVLELPEFERRVHLCADAAAEAKVTAEAVRHYAPAPEGAIAVGVPDPDVLPLVENELSRVDLASFNPEGRRRCGDRWYALLEALSAFGREPSFAAVAALARCPDFLDGLQARHGSGFSIARFLAELDDLQARHLPADLDALSRVVTSGSRAPHVRLVLPLLGDLHRSLRSGEFPENAVSVLNNVCFERRFDLRRDEEALAAESVDAWREVMRACQRARGHFSRVKPSEWWEVALRVFGESRRTADKPPGAVDLQGWLELLWEDAPHLVIAGMNDGFVPDAIVGDAFLPESLRIRLGLKTNAQRFARDAYLLQAIVESRRASGRVDLLYAKHSPVGDPLRPSRLLLRCRDDELPQRIQWLFRGAEAMRTNVAWTRAWKLTPRRVAAPEHVSVTGLRSWLACPFRFYLAQVLRMEAVDPTKSELDALDFGSLCHGALEAMAREPGLRDCTDEKLLREFLLARFDAAARQQFGDELTLPLVVQFESARQRLSRVAAVQANDRSEGWIIERAEWSFTLEVGGLSVRGKIDRCDRHEASGVWRVLDYKTTDAGPAPHKTHLRPFRVGDERLPSWMIVQLGGREYVWADLQLPLYLRALSADPAIKREIACGYFNLPKAAGETAIVTWEELTPALVESAQACAEGVAAAIRAGEFWPPAELPPERDPFAALFHHGAEESVAWEVAR